MLTLIALAVCVVIGVQSERLRWQQFLAMAVLCFLLVLAQSGLISANRSAQGRDGGELLQLPALLGNWAFTFGLWSAALIGGFFVSRWRRRK